MALGLGFEEWGAGKQQRSRLGDIEKAIVLVRTGLLHR